MKKDYLKRHLSLLLHKDVAVICQPFFQQAGCNIMNFIRLYNDDRIFYLCDNYDWLKLYLLNSYPSVGAFEQIPAFRKKEYVLWDALNDDDPIVTYSRKMFNVKMGLTLVNKFDQGYDFFNFGISNDEKSSLDNLAERLDDFIKFSQMFYIKAKRLINIGTKQHFNLADFMSEPPPSIGCEQEGKFYLGSTYAYRYLTSKEIAYLKGLQKGMTIPEVAQLHAISPRTIEKHIEHIKEKLHCKTQYELGYLMAKLGIDKL